MSAQGCLRLGFTARDGRTRLTTQAQKPPLQVVRAFDLADGAALAHLHNVSGGILGGDQLTMTVEVGPGAHVQLTTAGATRVYRSRDGVGPALQRTEACVGDGGLLEYLPDPLIPFAGANYRQETQITLGPGAGLFWWETTAPGRVAHGELFAYDRVEMHLDLTAAGRPIARERIGLEPALQDLASPARLGPYRYFTTFYICRVGEPADCWRSLESELAELAGQLTEPGRVLWGVSALTAHGLSVRGLSVSGRELAPGLMAFWQRAKRELYGREAIAPRKVY